MACKRWPQSKYMRSREEPQVISAVNRQEYYQALLEKKSEYEGVLCWRENNGVFCRPTCPARKPKMENCEFYETAQEAPLASFRPCKRCRPLSHPNQVSDLVRRRRGGGRKPGEKMDQPGLSEAVRRCFDRKAPIQKRFGMTFVEYARARRMGLALKQIREGHAVIDAHCQPAMSPARL